MPSANHHRNRQYRAARLPQAAAGPFANAETIIDRSIAYILQGADAEETADNLDIANAIRAVANTAGAQKRVKLQILHHQSESA